MKKNKVAPDLRPVKEDLGNIPRHVGTVEFSLGRTYGDAVMPYPLPKGKVYDDTDDVLHPRVGVLKIPTKELIDLPSEEGKPKIKALKWKEATAEKIRGLSDAENLAFYETRKREGIEKAIQKHLITKSLRRRR